jgi:hypothetical protein
MKPLVGMPTKKDAVAIILFIDYQSNRWAIRSAPSPTCIRGTRPDPDFVPKERYAELP